MKELENVKSFLEPLNLNILEANKKVDALISDTLDLRNYFEIFRKEINKNIGEVNYKIDAIKDNFNAQNNIIKEDIGLLNKKIAALIQVNNRSFFKRLFRKKLVFEE